MTFTQGHRDEITTRSSELPRFYLHLIFSNCIISSFGSIMYTRFGNGRWPLDLGKLDISNMATSNYISWHNIPSWVPYNEFEVDIMKITHDSETVHIPPFDPQWPWKLGHLDENWISSSDLTGLYLHRISSNWGEKSCMVHTTWWTSNLGRF